MLRQKDYPRQLLIGESIWTVRFVRRIEHEQPDAKKVTVGLCCAESQTVYIRQGIRPALRLETFIHEVTHAMEFEYGFKLNHDDIHLLDEPWAKFLIQNFLGGSIKRVSGKRAKVLPDPKSGQSPSDPS
jgi:hypothetical protein